MCFVVHMSGPHQNRVVSKPKKQKGEAEQTAALREGAVTNLGTGAVEKVQWQIWGLMPGH